jgi:hypothetical protein
MHRILVELFFICYFAVRMVAAFALAAGNGGWPSIIAAAFIIVYDLRRLVEVLHELWGVIYARRREAQLTWAIRWWCRHMPDEWFSPRHRSQTLGRIVRRHTALHVVN